MKMKRYFRTLPLLLAVLGAGCIKDPRVSPEGNTPGQIGIYLTRPERTQVTTRANTSADETIDPQSVCVLLFSGNDNNSALLDWGFATPVALQSYYGIKLAERSEACYAHIVVNFRSGIETASANWAKGSTTLADVRQSLITDPLPATSGVISRMPSAHPMTGGQSLPSGITAQTTIGTSAAPVVLTPATVRLTVSNQVPTGSPYTFELQGATLFNAPDRGYVLPSATLSNISYLPYGPDGDVSKMMAATETIEGISTTQPLYCYESAAANATSVIVKALYNGCEGYYRLNLYTADKKALRDLLRGYHYKIVVRMVQTAGYRTAAEAMNNPASNGILYDIEAADPDSYDIVTNGAQYLGVSNSEYWMYNSNYINHFEGLYNDSEDIAKATPFSVTILIYTANRTWQPGEVTASAGIHLQGDDGAKVSSLKLSIPTTEGIPVRRELKAFFDNDFTEGTLDIRIGDLRKVIKIRREHSASILGETFPLGKDVIYASAKPIDNAFSTTDITAYGLAYSETGNFELGGKGNAQLDPTRQLYLKVNNRFDKASADYCYSTIYLHRNTAEGRVKVDLAADLRGYDGSGDYTQRPLVRVQGTFHRSDQRGERLIQIPQNPFKYDKPYYGRWIVRVIKGQDFIRLAEWDDNLTMENGRFPGDPEQRTIDGDKTVIAGDDFVVRFRIGLTSTNQGQPNRYGLIQIIYVDKRVVNNIYDKMKLSDFIFVRQGENPDNILDPGKTYALTVDGTKTSFAVPDVKFSPYLLVDPTLSKTGTDVSDHHELTGDEHAVFAQYPTWFGYLFQWGGKRAFNPMSSSDASSSAGLTNWDKNWAPTDYVEHCPEGYITPPAQIGGQPFFQGLRCDGAENMGGNVTAPGVYMDGYLDRRIEVIMSPGANDSYELYNHAYERTQSSYYKVSGSTSNPTSCALGYVIYNPETMASMFFPMEYPRDADAGVPLSMRMVDPYIMCQTQTPVDSDPAKAYVETLSGYGAGPYIIPYGKAMATQIRCIKDPNKP